MIHGSNHQLSSILFVFLSPICWFFFIDALALIISPGGFFALSFPLATFALTFSSRSSANVRAITSLLSFLAAPISFLFAISLFFVLLYNSFVLLLSRNCLHDRPSTVY